MRITEKELRVACRSLSKKIKNRREDGLSEQYGESHVSAFAEFCGIGFDWDKRAYYLAVRAGVGFNACSNVLLTMSSPVIRDGLYAELAESIESMGIIIY